MSEHRVSVLSTSLRRHEDPARSRDPRVVSVLEALRTVEIAPPPRAHFRADLRAQLVAITPRIVAESIADGTAPATTAAPDAAIRGAQARPAPRPTTTAARPDVPADAAGVRSTRAGRAGSGVWAAVRALPIGRGLAVAAGVITVFALLLGGAVYLSRNALPGDSLYGVKRASEQFELYTDSSDTARAQDHLDFATTRVDEARRLAGRPSADGAGLQAGGLSPRSSQLIAAALRDADTDTRAASRLLGDAAVDSASGTPLTPMVSWAPAQLARLHALAAAVPDTRVQQQAARSSTLVRAAVSRADALSSRVGCGCLSTARTDPLGPVPGTAAPVTAGHPAPPGHPATGSAPAPTTPTVRHGGGTPSRPVTVPVLPPLTNSRSGSATPTPTHHAPGLPLPSITGPQLHPSSPVLTVGPCGIRVLILNLPLCPTSTP